MSDPKQLTKHVVDADTGDAYVVVPEWLWLDVLRRSGEEVAAGARGGTCHGHGGVESRGQGWVCCNDGHCFET